MKAPLCFFSGAALGALLAWAATRWRSRESDRLRGRFLAFATHELTSPVATLNMTVLNFLNELFGPVAQEQKPWLLLFHEQIDRLRLLLGDLRDFIHMELERDLEPELDTVSLQGVVAQCLESTKDSLARGAIAAELRLPDSLPSVLADPDRVSRIISAMLAHAVKFRASGSVLIEGKAEPGAVLLSIEYTGLKVLPAEAARALDLFHLARDSSSQVLVGTGLGLGLASRLVAAQGGAMTLTVDPTGRSRIAITLPQATGKK